MLPAAFKPNKLPQSYSQSPNPPPSYNPSSSSLHAVRPGIQSPREFASSPRTGNLNVEELAKALEDMQVSVSTISAFRRERIDSLALSELTDEELLQLAPALGDRKKIAKLKF